MKQLIALRITHMFLHPLGSDCSVWSSWVCAWWCRRVDGWRDWLGVSSWWTAHTSLHCSCTGKPWCLVCVCLVSGSESTSRWGTLSPNSSTISLSDACSSSAQGLNIFFTEFDWCECSHHCSRTPHQCHCLESRDRLHMNLLCQFLSLISYLSTTALHRVVLCPTRLCRFPSHKTTYTSISQHLTFEGSWEFEWVHLPHPMKTIIPWRNHQCSWKKYPHLWWQHSLNSIQIINPSPQISCLLASPSTLPNRIHIFNL